MHTFCHSTHFSNKRIAGFRSTFRSTSEVAGAAVSDVMVHGQVGIYGGAALRQKSRSEWRLVHLFPPCREIRASLGQIGTPNFGPTVF